MWNDYQYNDAVSNQNAANMDLIMESTRETKIDFLFLPVNWTETTFGFQLSSFQRIMLILFAFGEMR